MGHRLLTIGCHLSCAKGYAKMAQDAHSIGANTFQFFTRNPRGGKAKDIDPDDLSKFLELSDEFGIKTILAHAPYTLNPAAKKPEIRQFAKETLADDLKRMEFTPGQLYNMHPGAHVGQGVDDGIDKIAEILNDVIQPEQTTTVLLETMAGKGSEVGSTFTELAQIIDRIKCSDHIGVCLDTCHVWDAGYDIVGDLDSVLSEFDAIIGLDRLRAIHINDSKNEISSHKDRHEAIGAGYIGLDAIAAITAHPKLSGLPFYLETPHEKIVEYGEEIASIKAKREELLK